MDNTETKTITIMVEIYDETPVSDFEQAMAEGINGIDCSYEIIED